MAMTSYARRLGVVSGTLSVVGGIIGSGIFLNPAIVAQRAGTAALTLGAWVIGGMVALLGAFIYAELGSRAPRAGGGYVYIRDAFGPLPAFLSGWALLLAVSTGAIAAVAITFANYLVALMGWSAGVATPIAAAAIVVLTGINVVGVAPGAYTQNVFTLLKLGALGLLLLLAFAPGAPAQTFPAETPVPGGSLLGILGAALVPILFSYGGWQQTNYIAEELKDPERNLPKALLAGVAIVVVVYLAANVAYLRTLGVAGLAASTAPAADTMEAWFGPAGRQLISAGIVASTFGFLALTILASPRVYQAMAADGLFPGAFARLHPRFRTPVLALVLQAAWALGLLVWGSYGDLLDWVVFADWLTFGTVALSLVVYRRRAPEATGYRGPLYPWSVVLFVLAAAWVIVGSVQSNPGNALKGALMIGAGVPVYRWFVRRAGRRLE
ncbi:MAG TPA: amino acid permease [Gemmatimonadales bacterium]